MFSRLLSKIFKKKDQHSDLLEILANEHVKIAQGRWLHQSKIGNMRESKSDFSPDDIKALESIAFALGAQHIITMVMDYYHKRDWFDAIDKEAFQNFHADPSVTDGADEYYKPYTK